ncbi:MAG: DUF5069 domain-containing protein [Candidatus Latescibacterota bacterium]|jgi:hypothetical protein
MTQALQMTAPDLRQRPPRSPRVRLGGYATLPRMLDKGRAKIAEQNGEYHYNCPIDQHFIRYTGIDPEQLLAQLAAGHGDAAILEWIQANAQHAREPWEIAQWSAYHDARVPTDADTRAYFNDMHKSAGEVAEDIATWFDLLDLDDHTTFGGKA